ncbi:MAG TPA: TetR/AcrR family transcriptional regulator [Syntrophorhabdaceae bacterium]|nr:TetR/AcrR family transcriptional regulator [Syntrophorhabdaceae bacterium]
MPKMMLSRREREKLAHRNQILADALELFQEKGYHAVSMHEIAAKTEFSIGSLYKYFKNKEELYSAMMIQNAEETFTIIDAVLSRENDIERIIRDYIKVKIKLFTDNLSVIRLLLEETQREANVHNQNGFGNVLRKIHEKELRKVASLLRKSIRMKTIKKVDPYRLSVALNGMIHGFLFNWRRDPEKLGSAANTSLIADVFFKGCLAAREKING